MSHLKCMERRRFPRVELKAYGFHHHCRARRAGAEGDMILIDVSRVGARLREPSSNFVQTLESGVEIVVDLELSWNNMNFNGRSGIVRWISGGEFGVEFIPELQVGIRELQLMLET